MSEIELKPCPFCGGQPAIERSFFGGPYVLCGDCGAATMFDEKKAKAIELWNNRASLTPAPGDEGVERESVCAACGGARDDLAPGRDPEELCDPCYNDARQALASFNGRGGR